jgi:hypothetical protein
VPQAELVGLEPSARPSELLEAAYRRTLAPATVRGALLDLLATGELDRTTAAVRRQLPILDDFRFWTTRARIRPDCLTAWEWTRRR